LIATSLPVSRLGKLPYLKGIPPLLLLSHSVLRDVRDAQVENGRDHETQKQARNKPPASCHHHAPRGTREAPPTRRLQHRATGALGISCTVWARALPQSSTQAPKSPRAIALTLPTHAQRYWRCSLCRACCSDARAESPRGVEKTSGLNVRFKVANSNAVGVNGNTPVFLLFGRFPFTDTVAASEKRVNTRGRAPNKT
jgi:hypothetical protein